MIDFTIETVIARSPSEVFAYVTDPSRLESWQTNTVSAVPEPNGPIGVGTRIREVHRAPGGKDTASLVEVVEYEPDRAFSLHTIEGPPIDARITCEATGDGTRFRFRVHGRPTGIMRLGQPILTPILKHNFKSYCAALKEVIERGSPAF